MMGFGEAGRGAGSIQSVVKWNTKWSIRFSFSSFPQACVTSFSSGKKKQQYRDQYFMYKANVMMTCQQQRTPIPIKNTKKTNLFLLICPHTDTNMHTPTPMHMCTGPHEHAYTHISMHAHVHIRTHTHVQDHIRTHTHTCAGPHTHAHTHTFSLSYTSKGSSNRQFIKRPIGRSIFQPSVNKTNIHLISKCSTALQSNKLTFGQLKKQSIPLFSEQITTIDEPSKWSSLMNCQFNTAGPRSLTIAFCDCPLTVLSMAVSTSEWSSRSGSACLSVSTISSSSSLAEAKSSPEGQSQRFFFSETLKHPETKMSQQYPHSVPSLPLSVPCQQSL